MEPLHRHLFLAGEAGRLEAILWAVSQGTAPAVGGVVCHPHPLFGGTMHNKVVYQTAKTLHRYGLPVLRFNFRGAGLSEGIHDKGHGERSDVAAAIDFMASEYPNVPVLLAGFSFGAWVGLRVGCGDARVVELIGLGLPIAEGGSDKIAYLSDCAKPKLLLSGALDVYSPRVQLEAVAEKLPPQVQEQTQVQFIPQADHFFTGHLDEMDLALSQWLLARHPELSSQRD